MREPDADKGRDRPWQPSAGGGSIQDLSLSEVVGQALGSASMCWTNVSGAGDFDSEKCAWILDALVARIEQGMEDAIERTRKTAREESQGTTEELLKELARRGEELGSPYLQNNANSLLVTLYHSRPDIIGFRREQP